MSSYIRRSWGGFEGGRGAGGGGVAKLPGGCERGWRVIISGRLCVLAVLLDVTELAELALLIEGRV